MKDKGIVVITGSSSGIGRSLVNAFSAAGYRVAATARRAESIRDLSSGCGLVAALDVADERSVSRFASLIRRKKLRIAVLVNNAGFGAMGPIAEMQREDLAAQFSVNVFGAAAMVRSLLPFMDAGSTVVNIGSVSGDVVTPWAGAYCASKAALHAMSEAMRMELSPFGIRVMTVKPGGIVSRFGERAAGDVKGSLLRTSVYRRFESGILKRANDSQSKAASPDELAAAVVRAACGKRVPSVLRFGPKSVSLVVFKALLPARIFDRIRMKRYGLM